MSSLGQRGCRSFRGDARRAPSSSAGGSARMALRRSAARAACSSSDEASEPVSFGMVTEGGGGAWACDAPRENETTRCDVRSSELISRPNYLRRVRARRTPRVVKLLKHLSHRTSPGYDHDSRKRFFASGERFTPSHRRAREDRPPASNPNADRAQRHRFLRDRRTERRGAPSDRPGTRTSPPPDERRTPGSHHEISRPRSPTPLASTPRDAPGSGSGTRRERTSGSSSNVLSRDGAPALAERRPSPHLPPSAGATPRTRCPPLLQNPPERTAAGTPG